MKLLTGSSFFFIFLVVYYLSSGHVKAQDPLFSQFYATPLYLNPALAGSNDCMRIMAGYRNQWPVLDKSFTTYTVNTDRYVDALHGGVGIAVLSDDAAGLINTLKASAVYAYHLKLGNQSSLNAGIEAGFHQQRINWDKLIFPDMINPGTGQIISGSEPKPANTSMMVPDFSTGLLLGIANKYYAGIAVHHLAEPDISYYANSNDGKLFRKYTVHAGANLILHDSYFQNNKGQLSINPNVLYQQQQNAHQVNLGTNFTYYPITLGLWYRHNFENPDAVIFVVGIMQKRFKFGYSYDYSLSKLLGESGGAHEATVTLLINCEGKRNKPGAIKCPEF